MFNTQVFKNTILTPTYYIHAKRRPYGNNFTQKQYVKPVGKDAHAVIVLCTANSKEPGREYYCVYTNKGALKECCTLN
jgi:hypothetical protein